MSLPARYQRSITCEMHSIHEQSGLTSYNVSRELLQAASLKERSTRDSYIGEVSSSHALGPRRSSTLKKSTHLPKAALGGASTFFLNCILSVLKLTVLGPYSATLKYEALVESSWTCQKRGGNMETLESSAIHVDSQLAEWTTLFDRLIPMIAMVRG